MVRKNTPFWYGLSLYWNINRNKIKVFQQPFPSCCKFQLSYANVSLTGPIIVACQWNTEGEKPINNAFSSKMQTLDTFPAHALLYCNLNTIFTHTNKILFCSSICWCNNLQSSPTGPAEHWAGGSLCRSDSSWKLDNYIMNQIWLTGQLQYCQKKKKKGPLCREIINILKQFCKK